VVVPAATVTDPGTVSEVLLLASVTLEPPVGAVWDSVIVHVLTAPCPRLVGLQVTVEMSIDPDDARLIVKVFEPPLRVAVTVALWLLPMEAAAVALKVAVMAPAATVIDAGTVSEVLLLARATLEPPVGAAWVRVTVQVLTALCPRLVGLQVRVETCTAAASRLTVAVWELLPSVAVTVALWLLTIEAAAVALKVVFVAPAATVTDAGTLRSALLLATVTFVPPVGAAWVSVTVQVLMAPAFSAVGEQVTGWRDGTVMVPLTPEVTLKPAPIASAPIEFVTWIEVVVVAGAAVAVT
jgi:hypothetical protein